MAGDKEGRTQEGVPPGADEERRVSAERFDLVVNGVGDYGIFLLDAHGRVASWNTGAERLKGYSADEILGQHFSRFYPEESVAKGWPDYELEVAAREGRFEDEGWRVRKDGTQFWANVVITAIRDETGHLSGFLKITRDLTERKMQEEALRQSEERFRLLVEGVKDYAIFMLDPDGRVTSWNEGARNIKGYAAGEIIGRHFSTFYPPEAIARRWPEHELEMAQRDGRFEDEGWRVRKDGGQFWANVVITPLYGADGGLRGYAKVTRDLTERRRVASLEEANQRMNEFLAMVSHELRTPLNAMLGWVRLLRSGKLADETYERGLETIERNTVTQAQLIEDLLDVSRIVSGKMRLATERVSLEGPARAAVDSVRLAAEAKGVRLQTVFDSSAGLVSGDPVRLQQVIWNLLANAIKFTPRGGSVRLELRGDGPDVEISVADTGRGIAPEFLSHVFDRFRQADSSSSREFGGLGLGLSIVKHLVEAHGGTVRAESAGLDEGATFVVRLPASAPREQSEVAQSGSSAFEGAPSLAGVRVLVVDDEADTRDMLLIILGACGAEVRAAASAGEAIAEIEGWRPDVLVSDIGMPGEDGYSLIQRVRGLPPERGGQVPAVALTAFARFEDRLRALQAGYQMHVAKPVEPAELAAVVGSLLEFRPKGPSVGEQGAPKP